MVKNVLEYLEASAMEAPDKTVFADERTELTYGAFVEMAKKIGSGLTEILHGQTGQAVAVLIDRSVQPLAGFFGAVYSGNFYVPIDRRMPMERTAAILKTVRARVLLAQAPDGRRICTLRETMDKENFPQVVLEEEILMGEVNETALAEIARRQIDTDPLYAIFTSGSTGTPKGVLISHRSVIDLADQFREEFGFDETCVFGNQAPFDFDVSVKDIYSTIRNRATMHVISQMRFSFPVKLTEFLNDRKINTIIWAVSAFRIIENLNGFSAGVPQHLRRIFFSGEAMPLRVLQYLRRYLPHVRFVNLYGPTEITCNCTFYEIEKEPGEGELLPIGRPFKNSDVFLLEGSEAVTEPGERGEICIRGTSLALGYFNAPELSAEAFCQNPLNPYYPERIYRTGDIGTYNEAGELVFLSRRDAQIKHMGHRIELGEIEAAVGALDCLKAGVCVYADGKIILCYQADEPCEQEILRRLAKKLPKYMLPSRLEWYQTLPVNKNGKTDRTFLRQKYAKQ